VRDDPVARARGAELFAERCAMCHGAEGRGMPTPRPNEDGALNWARDLQLGFLKGDASADAIADRIRAGMPGSAMPGLRLDDEGDLAALVAHVQTLISPEAYRRRVQDRERVLVRRIDALPSSPDDPRFDTEHEIEVVLAPLWWDEDSITAARVSALHDGSTIAVRVRWRDATGEQRPFSDVERSDGAALQLSCAESPPLFGMGSHDEPNRVWHWRALRLSDAAGAQDLVRPLPHLLGDARTQPAQVDVPLYRRAEGVPAVSEDVVRLTARGIGDARTARDGAHEVLIEPRWKDGEWSVVFVRALADADDLACLAPGGRVQLALALWNGAAGDAGARKSISVWQELALER
jgi:DMSO reductase family type II enzyme heme b subunit